MLVFDVVRHPCNDSDMLRRLINCIIIIIITIIKVMLLTGVYPSQDASVLLRLKWLCICIAVSCECVVFKATVAQ